MTDRDQAVFGGLDGSVSAVGLILGGVAAGAAARTVVVTGLGLAVASAVSMAGGQALSDEQPDGRNRRATIMGLATLVGSFLPVVGFLAGRTLGLALGAALTITLGLIVAQLRPGAFWPSAARTFGVLAVAGGLSVAAAIGLGAVG